MKSFKSERFVCVIIDKGWVGYVVFTFQLVQLDYPQSRMTPKVTNVPFLKLDQVSFMFGERSVFVHVCVLCMVNGLSPRVKMRVCACAFFFFFSCVSVYLFLYVCVCLSAQREKERDKHVTGFFQVA